jgi:cytochrome P450
MPTDAAGASTVGPDLTDPNLYATGDPHAVWRWLRRNSPVHWHEPVGFWAVTGYQLGRRVLGDWQCFSSANGSTLRPDLSSPYPGGGKMLVLMDPPRHTELRRAVAHVFAPRTVARLGEVAASTARSVLHDAFARGSCDFVTDVAERIPLAVSAQVLGVRAGDVAAMAALARQAAAGAGGETGSAALAHQEIMLRFYRMMRDRDGGAEPDLLGALLDAQHNGVPISAEEILLTCDNALVAASETAVHAASGGLLALLHRPGPWAALRDGRARLSTAVEEILRWTTPGTHLLRTVVSDTVLGGVPVRAGDAVAVWLASANRDEAAFSPADELVLDRTPNPHLSFGAGVHFCLGAALARVVLSAVLTELIRLPGRICLAGEPLYNSSWSVWGLRSLPLTLLA